MRNRSIECGNDFFFYFWWDYEFYFCFIYILDILMFILPALKGNPLFDIQGFSIQF